MSDQPKTPAEAFTALLNEQLEAVRGNSHKLTADGLALLAASNADRPTVNRELAELRKALRITADMNAELQALITKFERGIQLATKYRKTLQ